jgi:NTE family protein
MSRRSTTVSLVLGSGGARGLAHIGVIRWLSENGYSIHSVSGSSIGALIGGVYAARKLEVYAQWVSALERTHVLRLLDPTFGRAGLLKGERIMGVLRDLIGDCAIEGLSMPFTAVATDLDSGQEVWLRDGMLFDAIRASIATPLLFTPVRLGSRTLLDGALVNPVPITPTLDDPTELTIAVDLNGPAQPPPTALKQPSRDKDPGRRGQRAQGVIASPHALPALRARGVRAVKSTEPGFIDIARLSMKLMQDTSTRLGREANLPDVTIEIPRNACGYHEFWRAEELIALGHEHAARVLASAESPHAGAGGDSQTQGERT